MWPGSKPSKGLFLREKATLETFSKATAVLQLLYTESTTAEWLFPQEKATLHNAGEGT
jgi:hypothetical protein